MSLYVLITGFGPPHLEHKLQILENNLEKIAHYPWTKLTIKIAQYISPDLFKIPETLIAKYSLEIIYEPGIVGEFIKRHAHPSVLQGYDYLLLLLDDVELQNIDFTKVIQYQKDLYLDVLSPVMSHDSKYQYQYMRKDNTNADIKVVTVCEYFCMFFPVDCFPIYYQHITLDNPWMWGLDLVLYKHLKLNIGLMNQFTMKHWYKSEAYALRPDADPVTGFHTCIARYGETPISLSEQKAVRYFVCYP